MTLLEKTKKESIHTVIHAVCEKWCLDESFVAYAARQYRKGSDEIPAIKRIYDTADYAGYCKKNGDAALKRFKYQHGLRNELKRIFNEDILPLRGHHEL